VDFPGFEKIREDDEMFIAKDFSRYRNGVI